MSAYQIQRELEKIDNKLTDLELKGRGLEDSIRKGKQAEFLSVYLCLSLEYV